MKKKVLTKIWLASASVIIIIAIISSLFRALTPWARQYKPQIEKRLSLLVGHQVTIGSMETAWHLFEPRIRLKNIHLKQTQSDSPSVGDIQVGINLIHSLWNWQIQPGRLYLDNVHLSLTEKNGHWHIDGLKLKGSQEEMSQDSQKMLGLWLALHRKIIIRDLSASLHFANGTLIPVSDLDLVIENQEGHYLLRGKARLEQMQQTSIKILADFNYNPYSDSKASGEIYFSSYHFVPAQWQAFLPKKYQRFQSGYGNAEIWLSLVDGQINQAQTKINLKQLAIQTLAKDEQQLIQKFHINLLYKKTPDGWDIAADKIRVRMGGINWPENQLKISHQTEDNQYDIYVQHILIDTILTEAEKWYEPLDAILKHRIHGSLTDSHLHLKNNQPDLFSSKFKQMGWIGNKQIPSVNHLCGNIHWQENEGYLQVDSQNSLLALGDLPAQTFSRVIADLNWKYIRNKWRLNVDRFLLKQPDLTFTLKGMMDDPLVAGKQQVNLKAAFAVKHAEHWLSYLNKKMMKPSLVDWLQTDIKSITRLDGKLSLRGNMSDFPFEKSEGEFKIHAHLNDGVVRINSQWPFAQKVDAELKVDKRLLDIDIIRGHLLEVPVNTINLRIADIGLDKEVLLARANINAAADKMSALVMASPLKKKLSAIERLNIEGPLFLDLNLQVPLYDHNLPILVRGQIDFENNQLSIKHPIGGLNLSELKGQLFFDEHGLRRSKFNALAFDYPLQMSLYSSQKPEPYTAVEIHSNIDVEDLKKQYPMAVFNFMAGRIATDTVIKITDDTEDLDQVHIHSKLKGLNIDLPAPIGKKAGQERDLQVDINFNTKSAVHVKVNFNKLISSNLWFNNEKSNLMFDAGEIRFGSGQAIKPEQPGLSIVGSVNELNLDAWISTFKKAASDGGSPLLAKLNFIDVKFNQLILYQQLFKGLYFKALKKSNHLWAVDIKQGKFTADLEYDVDAFSVNGKARHFVWKPAKLTEQKQKVSKLDPSQLPDLNLDIQQLYYDKYLLGDLSLKGSRHKNGYEVNFLQLKGNDYQLNAVGDWKKGVTGSKTKIKSDLRIVDLAQTLKHFGIEPVVEARQGRVKFDGGWKGSYFDYKLSEIFGKLSIVLRNGRITHLSQETEEKMALGKLLSILSLQTIPRRLVLDFSDLSQKGYSFDQFTGYFNFKKGLLTTRNSTIDGPVAYGSMTGSLDMLEKRYDIELKISPHITASLPIVATIAGGPIAGVAAWIASKVINRGMHKINAYTYKITGPWDSPVVQQLKIIRQKK